MAKQKKEEKGKKVLEGEVIEEKREQGRPTKFKPEYNQMLVDFFSIEPFMWLPIENTNAKGESYTTNKLVANKLPTFQGFADKIGVNVDTIFEWAKEENKSKYLGFSDSYIRARAKQKDFLIQNGLLGLYNPKAFVFVAKNLTDMKDEDNVNLNAGGSGLGLLILPPEIPSDKLVPPPPVNLPPPSP